MPAGLHNCKPYKLCESEELDKCSGELTELTKYNLSNLAYEIAALNVSQNYILHSFNFAYKDSL